MKDRITATPNRVKLVPVSGQANTYDIVRADNPTQAGTPLNKANLLTDAMAAALGISSKPEGGTVNDAFTALYNDKSQVFRMTRRPTEADAGHAGDIWLNMSVDPVEKYICVGASGGVYTWDYITTMARRLFTEVFTTSQNWTVPALADGEARVFLVGGGGGGDYAYGGGGGSGRFVSKTIDLKPYCGQSIPVNIGAAGGYGNYAVGHSATNGGDTIFGTSDMSIYAMAAGGGKASNRAGGAGGAGGGGAGYVAYPISGDSQSMNVYGGSGGVGQDCGGGGGGGAAAFGHPNTGMQYGNAAGNGGGASSSNSTRLGYGGGGGSGYAEMYKSDTSFDVKTCNAGYRSSSYKAYVDTTIPASRGTGGAGSSNSNANYPAAAASGNGTDGISTVGTGEEFEGPGTAGSGGVRIGGGGGGGRGGRGGNGAGASVKFTRSDLTYTEFYAGAGGGGGGYGADGGHAYASVVHDIFDDKPIANGGGGGGYGSPRMDASATRAGGGGGYGPENYGRGGGAAGDAKSGVVILSYYAFV